MANPQPNEFTKLSNELYGAIMQRDFTKRQRNIIDLVIRMSYGCGMKTCFLRPSDFSVVGVQKQHITKELEYLERANVLVVNGNEIVLNKDYERWSISLVKSYNEEKFNTILRTNLEFKAKKHQVDGYQKSNFVTETVTLANESYQNSNHGVTETVTDTPLEALSGAGFQAPKESIKEIAAATDDEPPISPNVEEQQLDERGYVDEIEQLMKVWNHKFVLRNNNGFNQARELFAEGVPIRFVKQGIDSCFERNPEIKTFSYCVDRIREIYQREIDLQSPVQHGQASQRGQPKRNKEITQFQQCKTSLTNQQSSKYDVFYQYYESQS